jgi:glycosyltransferase involved in cell wall biosynthesis
MSGVGRPRVSVITIFLDEERFLSEAIESVRCQTFQDWELLLVDDGSTDRSGDVARAFAEADPTRVRCLRHPGGTNRGMSASRNLGIGAARGELVAFLDGDDTWLPEKLADQVAVFDRERRVSLVYGRTLIWNRWESGSTLPDFCYPLGVEPDRLYEPPRLFNVLMRNRAQTPTTCNAVVRRSLIDRVGGFVEEFRGLFEDQVFFAKALLAAPAWVDGRTWARYRQHAGSCTGGPGGWTDELRSRLRFLAWVRDHLDERGGAPVSARLALARADLGTRFLLWRARMRTTPGDSGR